jgi:hypothetical protein
VGTRRSFLHGGKISVVNSRESSLQVPENRGYNSQTLPGLPREIHLDDYTMTT